MRARVPAASVAPYLYAADCLIVPPYAQRYQKHRRRMLPIKVFSYLAAGRAILAPRLPDIEEVLTDDRTARLYDPADTEHAVKATRLLLADETARARLGQQASAAASAYTWAARARRIVDFLDAIAPGYPRSAIAAAASSR
jgi:glycosyltransferase involved in cell wall biosynthesis